MTGRSPLAYAVLGDPRIASCPDCAVTVAVTGVFYLTDDGVTRFGDMVNCHRCGDLFRCLTCRALMAQDGSVMFDHMVGHA